MWRSGPLVVFFRNARLRRYGTRYCPTSPGLLGVRCTQEFTITNNFVIHDVGRNRANLTEFTTPHISNVAHMTRNFNPGRIPHKGAPFSVRNPFSFRDCRYKKYYSSVAPKYLPGGFAWRELTR